ncbi:phosphoribosylglycinamide formyltransferase [Pediococcus acidilactici]|uniref:phosphoribosylglycinamide formyltransferase n=1 Tax=Pediococcus acidilactici TaxID=1254 RepID=UPI001CCFB9B8|nr:phosphoribosylglycinamide formyltransferase [Pediococcus acidilactici]
MIKIAIFASGTGTNFVALAHHIEETNVPIRIACLVCDQPDAPVVEKAVSLGIPVWTHRLGEFADKTAYEQAILLELQKYDLKLIVLAGYMKIITEVLLEAYPQAIINIHPALLPAFPGRHGIEDALAYGVKVTGVTVHWIDDGIDTGPIIAQRAVSILPDDDVTRLAQRIHLVEHELYFVSLCEVLKQRKLIK